MDDETNKVVRRGTALRQKASEVLALAGQARQRNPRKASGDQAGHLSELRALGAYWPTAWKGGGTVQTVPPFHFARTTPRTPPCLRHNWRRDVRQKGWRWGPAASGTVSLQTLRAHANWAIGLFVTPQ